MPCAVVLHRDDREVQVWLSKEHRIEVIDSNECPDNASVGTPLELKIDSRHRVEECTVIDRPLKMQTQIGLIMFLDIFLFPDSKTAFSQYFGVIPIDSDFTPVESNRTYLTYVTWDKRRCEMIILKQSPPRILPANAVEINQLMHEYEYYHQPTYVDGMPVVTNEEQPKKEKLTVAIPPMERRGESLRDEDERSMSDRMSSISSKMDSVSVRALKMDDGRSSVRSSNETRTERPSMTHSNSFTERNDSIMNQSGYSRAGSGVHSSNSYNKRETSREDSSWERGIVTGEHKGNPQDLKKFFVWTSKGSATVYPRVYEKMRYPLTVGEYVKVDMRSRDGSDHYEVEDIVVSNWKPFDHKMQMRDGVVMIRCQVKFVDRMADNYTSWWIAENSYLGRIGVEVMNGETDVVGTCAIITVKHLRPGLSIVLEKEGVGWVATKDKRETIVEIIEKKEMPVVEKKEVRMENKKEEQLNEWYTGIVTAVTDDSVFVASPRLKEDAVLFQKHPEDVIGLWINFEIGQFPGDPSERHRINPNSFSKIDPVYQTRIKRGVPEIRIPLTYEGDEDDGRAMLNSVMGKVRDCDGQLPTDRDALGRYNVWIVRYKKANQISRWRFSRVDPHIERDNAKETNRSRSPSPTTLKHRAIEEDRMRQERLKMMEKKEKKGNEVEYEEGELELREIMKRVILENDEIRYALKEADSDAFNEMFEILMEDIQ